MSKDRVEIGTDQYDNSIFGDVSGSPDENGNFSWEQKASATNRSGHVDTIEDLNRRVAHFDRIRRNKK